MKEQSEKPQRKVAIVTGATAGLGKAIAIRLAQEGVFVVVTGRNQAAGEALVASIHSSGGQGAFLAADIEDTAGATALVKWAIEEFGQVDILVASAGAPPAAQGVIGQVAPNAIADQIAKTARIKLNPVHAVVPHMTERESGSILFVTSEGGRFPTPGQTTVALHSGGLIMAAKVMAKELSRSHVRVNTLCVTLVEDTPVYERFAGGQLTPIRQKVFDKIASKAPFGLAKPDDVAAVAAFLVSDAASHITGATLSATGGQTYS
ncbi:SDR family NAD(P)-dependent oxidoreductase [Cupriavidus lacunae]|uniref:3-oxoacyl-ACP reductase n=1 Tax=Cupriavidus lacunae TaxID=2666307 RepID=A0A370NLP1_9BURK|nr:SDR family oxidoreductase [Cupriavidus lacunae]RDK06527.1 3-oxoacyl-ACP reductase [Cupriavidus lacunae]